MTQCKVLAGNDFGKKKPNPKFSDFWLEKQTDKIHSVVTNVLNLEQGQERDVEGGWMDG